VSVHAAPTEHEPTPGVAPALDPSRPDLPARASSSPSSAGGRALWWPTLLIAGIACFVTFYAKGGLNLESMTATEIALTLASGLTVAAAVLLTRPGQRSYGLWPVGLLLAFTVLTAISVVWSVQPDHSWQDSGRMLAYSGVFASAVALVRIAPERWPAVLGGLTLAAVLVCAYALATKVFPGQLAPTSVYARLEEPYGYWNAIGLTAAMGVICCLWLGARRSGHALLSALAYPATGLLLLTLVLAYSRGALAALAVGVVLWFCLVPLRLRGAAVLILGGIAAGGLTAWDFSQHALSYEGVPLDQRAVAGHRLGALILAMVLLLSLAGVAIGFLTARRPPSLTTRRRAGAILLALIALAGVGFLGALAHSRRGLTGSISHAVDSLTNPNAKTPPNTPDRLTAVASVRARYWKEALQIFAAHPALGVGAEGYQTARLRYRKETLEVKHAHGFVVQTLADLGLVGLVLALLVLLTWMAAAGRATHPFNRRWSTWRELRAGARPGWRLRREPYSPERVGLLAMLCLVVVFGVHSLVDWTWYVPGDACVALLCAGWLAGRGPLRPRAAGASHARAAESPHVERPANRRWTNWRPGSPGGPSPYRWLLAGAAIVAALLAAWSQWQPQRSEDARQEALALLARDDPRGAEAAADTAVARDSLSAEALLTLAGIQRFRGRTSLARATLQRAVRLQPSNPQTWLALGRYDLASDPRASLTELQAAIYLNPESIAPEAIARGEREAIEIQNYYIQALRASATAPTGVKSASGSPARAAAAARRAARRRRAPGPRGSRSPRPAG
jgi:O-antigen ligase/polysaccharide polymerase Wzy-like membrane protein/tetratricopeptide repeat protein